MVMKLTGMEEANHTESISSCSTVQLQSPRESICASRVLCALAWLFCLPGCMLYQCLRESPADEEDVQEDPSLPCW